VSIDAGPPTQPPQLSPDGNWVWDGSQWQPVTGGGAAPAHAGVFKAYETVVVEPAAPTVEAVPLGVQYEQQYPAPAPSIDYSYRGSEPDLAPLWQQTKGGGYGRYLYFVAAIALFVIVLIVLNSMNFVQLPLISTGSKSSPTQVATPAPSPTPDTSGSDLVRADRFFTGTFKPGLDALDSTRPALYQWCSNGLLSTNCFDAMTAADKAVIRLLAGIDAGDIPSCIAAPMKKIRSDVQGMKAQIETALNDFQFNNKNALASAVYNFSIVRKALDGDVAAAQLAEMKCYPVVLPTWVPD